MNVADMLETLGTRGVEVLEEVHSGRLTRDDISRWFGASTAGSWRKLAATYCGPTRARTSQAQAVTAARGLPVAALQKIERHLRTLLSGAALSVWELRIELCGLRGTVDEIDRAAAARVRDLNRPVKDAAGQAHGRRALKGGKNSDGLGLRTCTLTLPERQMATLLSHLHPTAHRLRRENPTLTYEQAMADAAYRHVLGGVPTDGTPPIATMAVMSVPAYAKILRHEGDETVFGLTDGTTITGSELVAQELTGEAYIGLFDPVEGAVNAYRDARFANAKQRMLLAADTLVCPYPECTTPADQCQVHHIDAWSHGGDTNIANLTIACRVHNSRNDDNPHAPPRHGRLIRDNGEVRHHPPDGGPPRTNRHPLRKLSARRLLTTP